MDTTLSHTLRIVTTPIESGLIPLFVGQMPKEIEADNKFEIAKGNIVNTIIGFKSTPDRLAKSAMTTYPVLDCCRRAE